MNRVSRNSAGFISLTSRQPTQRGQARTQRAVDGAGDRAAATATVTGIHARHAVGVGHDVQALHACVRVDGVADRRAAGHAGEFAIAQFGAGGRLVDSFGGIGIDSGRIGVFATVATNCDGLHVTVEHDDAVALGLRWQTERCAGGAADQQQTGQTSLESSHGIDSFFGGLALVQRCEMGQSRCRAEFWNAFGFNELDLWEGSWGRDLFQR
ncbi:hypothetical protein D3C76_1227720 [compost metagenome]